MKPIKEQTLKDRERQVIDNRIHSLRNELSRRYERDADKLLGYRKPVEVPLPTVSGGRPESNRRKF